ncbi:hypothetical protein HK099_005840, partial [Clydaea vesicula]
MNTALNADFDLNGFEDFVENYTSKLNKILNGEDVLTEEKEEEELKKNKLKENSTKKVSKMVKAPTIDYKKFDGITESTELVEKGEQIKKNLKADFDLDQEKILKSGNEFFKKNLFREAIKEYSVGIKNYEKKNYKEEDINLKFFLNRGFSFQKLNEFFEALEDFNCCKNLLEKKKLSKSFDFYNKFEKEELFKLELKIRWRRAIALKNLKNYKEANFEFNFFKTFNLNKKNFKNEIEIFRSFVNVFELESNLKDIEVELNNAERTELEKNTSKGTLGLPNFSDSDKLQIFKLFNSKIINSLKSINSLKELKKQEPVMSNNFILLKELLEFDKIDNKFAIESELKNLAIKNYVVNEFNIFDELLKYSNAFNLTLISTYLNYFFDIKYLSLKQLFKNSTDKDKLQYSKSILSIYYEKELHAVNNNIQNYNFFDNFLTSLIILVEEDKEFFKVVNEALCLNFEIFEFSVNYLLSNLDPMKNSKEAQFQNYTELLQVKLLVFFSRLLQEPKEILVSYIFKTFQSANFKEFEILINKVLLEDDKTVFTDHIQGLRKFKIK